MHLLLILILNLAFASCKPSPQSGPSVNLGPGPFGSLDNLDPPSVNNEKKNTEKVFIPPDIKYWAYGKLNTTILDAGIDTYVLSTIFMLRFVLQEKAYTIFPGLIFSD